MKEQNKAPEEQVSDMEMDNVPKKAFSVMIVKIIKEVGRRMNAEREVLEVFSKELENTKNNQTDMKNWNEK